MTAAPDPFAWFDDTAEFAQALAEFAAALASHTRAGIEAAEDHANGEDEQ